MVSRPFVWQPCRPSFERIVVGNNRINPLNSDQVNRSLEYYANPPVQNNTHSEFPLFINFRSRKGETYSTQLVFYTSDIHPVIEAHHSSLVPKTYKRDLLLSYKFDCDLLIVQQKWLQKILLQFSCLLDNVHQQHLMNAHSIRVYYVLVPPFWKSPSERRKRCRNQANPQPQWSRIRLMSTQLARFQVEDQINGWGL